MFIDMKARCFMEAGRCLNFTRAAENLYISQPALSKNIAALEDECKMKLFYRDTGKGGVRLTAAGAVLLDELQKTEARLQEALGNAKRAESGQEGSLTIGLLFGQIINDVTMDVLKNIDENYPGIAVEKIQGNFRDLRNWLEDGTADIVVTYEEEACLVKHVRYEEVQQVRLGFVIPISHPLAAKEEICLRDLEGEKVIVPDDRESFTVTERFRQLCLLAGFVPEEIVAPDLSHMNMMAEMGKGILISREDSIVTRSPHLRFYPSEELGTVILVAAWKEDNQNPIVPFYHRMYEKLYHQNR